MCSYFFRTKILFTKKLKNKWKELVVEHLVCNLPNKSKLYIVQLKVVQKYMDIA